MKKVIKFFFYIILAIVITMTSTYVIYTKLIPAVVKSKPFIEFVQNKTKEYLDLDLVVIEPELYTSLDNNVGFKFKNLTLSKNDECIFNLDNFSANITLYVGKKIRINSLYGDYIFADINKLMDSFPQSEDEQELFVDFFHSVLYVKKLDAKYDISKDAKVFLHGNDLVINATEENKKTIKFDILTELTKNNKIVKISANDDGNVYITNDKLFIDNIFIDIDKSKVLFNLVLNNDYSYNANVYSKAFDISDIANIINSNLLADNTSELISYFNDIKGILDFNVNIENNQLKGNVNLKNLGFRLKYLENMPVTLTGGKIDITKNEIKLKNFKGYYNNKTFNKLDFEGSIKDYWNSLDTDITGNALVTNDFAKNYLSKLAGYPMEIQGTADTKIMLKSKYNKIDILWLYRFKKGTGFLFDGEPFGPLNIERALASYMHINGPILNIEKMNYIMGAPDDPRFKMKPILTFHGNVDLAHNCNLLNFGFEIPNFITSRFINMLVKQQLFNRGTIRGKFEYINTGKYPYLSGNIDIEKVFVPSQRMYIRNVKISAKDNLLSFESDGKYKRSDYKIEGNILNKVALPVIVKDVNLTVDNIDVERFMTSINSQADIQEKGQYFNTDNTEESDDVPTLDLSTLIVEKGILNLVKGSYKDIKFSNVLADLTFDKNQILEIKSNRFDFAEGTSGTKIVCDLKNQLYSIKLGVKDINSDLIASTLLGLPKEISGKASGFINLNTDETLKMNGQMKFNIKNGSIAKIGLFEYVLKFTSVFRNPIVSISPTTIFDFANVPNGDFDIIKGTLNIADNIVKNISITSSSPLMSSYIAGRYNLENRDAALRIYIKYSRKNKGFYGLLRNISIGSIANRVPFGAKSSNNYYEREIEKIPPLEGVDENDCQIYLTKVDGDVENNNFISFLKKLK